MKTLFVVIMLIYGTNKSPDEYYVDLSYIPSHEECTKKAIPFIRLMTSEATDGEIYMMGCIDVNEEEQQNVGSVIREYWPTKPKRTD